MTTKGIHLNQHDNVDLRHGHTSSTQFYDSMTIRKPESPSTFWRSPYNGGSPITSVLRTTPLIRPVLKVSPPNNDHTPYYTSLSPRLTVKSILKHTNENDDELHSPREDVKVRTQPDHPPNLITTGTGKGRPHGSPVRSRTAGVGKRVQFSGKGQLAYERALINGLSPTPYHGRRLYLDRATSNRILGDPRSSLRGRKQTKSNISYDAVNNVETSIKSQIQSFIRKLRISENEKTSNSDSGTRVQELHSSVDQKTATKLKHSNSPLTPDWSEFDLEKRKTKLETHEDQSKARNPADETAMCNVFDAKSRTISDSVSIESFSSVHEGSIAAERSPSGSKTYRPKPNASLYTKYSHITTNDVNKYGIDYNASRERNSRNFCDKRKTSQILGWLDDVRKAQENVDADENLSDT